MGAHMRAHDWSNSPLGPPQTWPQSLRIAVRLMLNTGHPMYIFWGPDLICLYNDAYSQSIGPERHPGSLGQPGRQVWGEIWDIIGPQIDQVMTGRGATWHENALVPITRNGQREDVYWTYSYSPIDDDRAEAGIGGVLVVCTETTQAIQAHRHKDDEVRRQRRMFEQAPSFVCILHGPDHVFEFVNNAHRQLFNSAGWVGKPLREAFPDIAGQGFYELMDQVYETGERFVARAAPVRFRAGPDAVDEVRYLDFIYEPLSGDDGQVFGIFCEGFDITDTHRAEAIVGRNQARQTLLFDLLKGHRETDDPDAIILAAVEGLGRHLGVNRVGFFEVPDVDTLDYGLCWTDGVLAPITGPWPAANIGSNYRQAKREGLNPGVADVTTDPLTSNSKFMELGARAVASAGIRRAGRSLGGIYAHHATPRDWDQDELDLIRDVAEQTWDAVERARSVRALRDSEEALRELARAMSEARNAAEQANIAKTDFLANMSHEIRTPMNAVIGATQILSRSAPLTERQEKVIAVLSESATALMDLINQILDLSKIEARNLQLEHAAFDARHMVDDIVQMMALQARAKNLGLSVRNSCDCVTERLFIGDVARIKQILVNLCSNAIKFTETGKIVIALSCTPPDQPNDDTETENLIFTVSDTGIGIAPDKLDLIFHKFSQADSSINRKYGGSGLGLSIAKSLTEAMGGSITAHSTAGRGSSFTVSLPLQRAKAGTQGSAAVRDGMSAAATDIPILLVEDSPANVMVAVYFLEDFGYVCEVADDGRVAVDLIQQGRTYGAILMDVQMPGMDGIEATRQIRQYEDSVGAKRTPIIAMTAHAMVADRQRCLAAGMDDYIAKPFDPQALRAKLLDLVKS